MLLSPAERDPIKLADWIELQVLYSHSGSFALEAARSQIDIDGSLSEEELDEPDIMLPERSEALMASGGREIERRASILGEAYPFEKSDGVLRLSSNFKNCIPYIFCLLAADRDFYSSKETALPRLFEHLTREALLVYLGGEAVRFGAPRDTMPRGIRDAIDKLAQLTGDERIQVYPVNDTDKDLGVDVVGWKDFADKYVSKLEVYMQCATGEHWSPKRSECHLPVWDSILKCTNERIVGLAIPYVVAEGDEWKRAAVGLLFMDRLRIASVLRGQTIPDAKYKWRKWCTKRIRMGRAS